MVTDSPHVHKFQLFNHQIEAISCWKANGCKGILSMATGTGKTYTAIGALDEVLQSNKMLFTAISVPYAHLMDQWLDSIKKYGLDLDYTIKCFSENTNWHQELKKVIRKMKIGQFKNVLIISTHKTMVSEKMNELIDELKNQNIATMIIGDEVHGLGSEKRRENLSELFEYRLGLSATPKRMYDEIGNRFLHRYFGDVVYEFSLCKAIDKLNPATYRTYLTPYYYFPYICTLTSKETEEYNEITRKILQKISRLDDITYDDIESDEEIKRLLIIRSKIIKAAREKINILKNILVDIKVRFGEVNHTIIFTDDRLITETLKLLHAGGFIAVRFTQELNIDQRNLIIDQFEKGNIDVLVAMKILDEGVDIPNAKIAVLMSSTSNPREYIQRLGRILRIYDGKDYAYIYDIIVKPAYIPDDLFKLENTVFKVEKERVKLIAECALNYKEAIDKII